VLYSPCVRVFAATSQPISVERKLCIDWMMDESFSVCIYIHSYIVFFCMEMLVITKNGILHPNTSSTVADRSVAMS
jgi:hypothetical protein